jgi:hypothetical protein
LPKEERRGAAVVEAEAYDSVDHALGEGFISLFARLD